MNPIKLVLAVLAFSMLTGIKCNKSASKEKGHPIPFEHDDQWSRIEGNTEFIREQISTLCEKSEALDSLLDAARWKQRLQYGQPYRAPQEIRLESPGLSTDSLIFITQ